MIYEFEEFRRDRGTLLREVESDACQSQHRGVSPPPARRRGSTSTISRGPGLRVVERRFEPKDTIFTPGDPDDQLYFLLSGAVRLYKIYGDYKEATTALLKDSGVFGKLNLVEGRWQDVFAEAVTEARVASIQKAALERVIKSDPSSPSGCSPRSPSGSASPTRS